MLLSKTVMVKWNGFTTKWYKDKGYTFTKQGDLFECKVEDLQPGSTVKVLVDCDYKEDGCKGVHEKPYRQYTEDKENKVGNCCTNKKCGAMKTKDICNNKYGVDNIQKLEEYKINSRLRQQKSFSLFIDCANKKGLILLTTKEEYENKRTRIRFICPKHKEFGEQSTYAEVFLKNKGCCNYGKGELCAESSRLDGNIVYQAFIDKGVLPQFNITDYLNNQQQLPFICPEHIKEGIQYRSYVGLISSQHKCNHCFRESQSESIRTEEIIVFNYFNERGLFVLEGESYKNKDTTIKYKCNKHPEHVQYTTYSGLKNTKQPCDYCRAEESLAKLNRRLRSSINIWKKQSKLNCQNKCIFTGSKKYDIHHLKSYNEIIKEALIELNYDIKDKYTGEEFINIKNKVVELHYKYPLGVCISNRIHVIFHQLYSKEASIEDFYEFKNRYELGEFDKLLKEVG